MDSTLLTTGQAARLCSVTPDTVLKWIRSGRLRARRTAGGHHRIDRRDLDEFLRPHQELTAANTDARPFRYCWEHMGNGKLLDGCRECVVYELRAHRCYEVVKVAQEQHTKQFCTKTCQDCDYYKAVHEQATNVLLVTDNERLADGLAHRAEGGAPFSLATTDCEYKCSALVETFRPDYVVIDCSLGPDAARDIANHLVEDPRVPFVKVIMAAGEGELPQDCDKSVFATIDKPLKIEEITGVIFGQTTGENR